MAGEIQEPKLDESTWVLWKYVTQVVKFCNALRNLKVTVAFDADNPSGKLNMSDANAILELHLKKGGGDLETVAGSVNGVASTLNVQTDGNGWTLVT